MTMKLLILNTRVIATATDEYSGPHQFLSVSDELDLSDIFNFKVINGSLIRDVPQSITRAQGKLALINAGLWPTVQGYVRSIADPIQKALAEVALNDTSEWSRASPFLNTAAADLGLTERDLDQLFIAAHGIQT